MKTKKNTIRLTENELKNIITESVKTILEGQGFDFFKSTYDDMKNDDDYSLSDFKNFFSQNGMDDIKDFIKKGHAMPGEAGDYYDPNDPLLSWNCSTKGETPLKKINKTPYGKIGRAAGSVGAMGIAGMKALGNSIRKKL